MRLPSLSIVLWCCLCAACSDRTDASKQPQSTEPASAAPIELDVKNNGANVRHAKLTASGIPAEYAAHFEAERLARIIEQRKPQSGSALTGEYTFEGARLIRYRGAKVAAPAELDLQFDMQGVLQSGRGPDVSDADITAIRTRAQLLRSHALAQRDVRAH